MHSIYSITLCAVSMKKHVTTQSHYSTIKVNKKIKLTSLVLVNFDKFSSNHGKVVICHIADHHLVGTNVWDSYRCKRIVFLNNIAERVQIWEYFELIFVFGRVKDKIGTQKTEICEFVSLTFVTTPRELKHKSS
jgi:hypothetical protein